MDKYRKVKIIGKGSFGYAVLVRAASTKDEYYVMKVLTSSADHRHREDGHQAEERLDQRDPGPQVAQKPFHSHLP